MKAIETAILKAKPDVVIHGAAPGADLIAEGLCKRHEIDYRGYPAKWKTRGKRAGPQRNLYMLVVEHQPGRGEPIDLCLAFPHKEGIGTQDMMALCAKAGIEVIVDTRML